MTITNHLDAWEATCNFERVYVGPGVYVLFDGRASDSNIVYIGKSAADVLMRVAAHEETKSFDRVGVILPRRTDPLVIHNLEHFVMEEFADRFGALPPYNVNHAHLHPEGPRFDWHQMGRRPGDALFLGGSEVPPPAVTTRARSVGEFRRLHERLLAENADWTVADAWEEVSRRLGGVYSPSTLRQYCASRHGNEVLPWRG